MKHPREPLVICCAMPSDVADVSSVELRRLVIKNAWATDRQPKKCEMWRQDAPAEVSVASDTPEAVSLTDGDERLRRQRRSRRLSSCAAPAPRRRRSRRASPAPSPALREERRHRQRQVCTLCRPRPASPGTLCRPRPCALLCLSSSTARGRRRGDAAAAALPTSARARRRGAEPSSLNGAACGAELGRETVTPESGVVATPSHPPPPPRPPQQPSASSATARRRAGTP